MLKWIYKVKKKDGYIYYRILFFRFKRRDKDVANSDYYRLRHVGIKEEPTYCVLTSPGVSSVGKWTYADEYNFRVAYPNTSIGSFCSIGSGCVLGCGKHPLNFLSTSPYFYFDALHWKKKEVPSHNEYWINEPVEIGHDVWLGEKVFVMNGVKIGTGAVVGTGSVVTKDVPPYAIVAGVPARLIRYRFEERVINELLASKWWELDDEIIKKIPYDNIEETLTFLKNVRKKMKRISVYFLWDKDGAVADYVLRQLGDIRPHVEESCVVVNGFISDEGLTALKGITDTVLVRDNVGLDAAAYQHAIRHYGYEKLKEYDELLLWNFTCYGPISSFDNIFSEMNQKECGFWGLIRWPICCGRPYHHIPSFFCGYRKELLQQSIFKDYWENLGDTSTYELSVINHEQHQTPYYESHGIKTATWFENIEKYKDEWHTSMMPLYCADRLLIEDAFPMVKRRIFYPESIEYSSCGSVALAILKYIKSTSSLSDFSLIVRDICQSHGLHSYYVSPLRVLCLRVHTWLTFSKEKKQKRKQKLKRARSSRKLYKILRSGCDVR